MSNQDIHKAVDIIRNEGIVAFPTETVYGLGGNAYSDKACAAIFAAKGRPSMNPLIVHVPSVEQAMDLATFNDDAVKLTRLWPGPISFVLPLESYRRPISEYVTAGLDTIAIRIPAHPVALKFINSCGVPIAAPSANKSGFLSTTTAKDVYNNFGDEVFVIDRPVSPEVSYHGIESTIIDLSGEVPMLLRLGFYTQEQIMRILDKEVVIADKDSAVKAPGMLLRHYAPKAPIRLHAVSLESGEVALNFGDNILHAEYALNLSESGDLAEAATNLYEYLHILDDYALVHAMKIAVAPVPNIGIGMAINDRLNRAAQSN
jgi:L-threonylcarbamoyladenylate synthase